MAAEPRPITAPGARTAFIIPEYLCNKFGACVLALLNVRLGVACRNEYWCFPTPASAANPVDQRVGRLRLRKQRARIARKSLLYSGLCGSAVITAYRRPPGMVNGGRHCASAAITTRWRSLVFGGAGAERRHARGKQREFCIGGGAFSGAIIRPRAL